VIHNLGGSLRQAFLTVLQTSRVKNKPAQAEAWAKFPRPFGPALLPKALRAGATSASCFRRISSSFTIRAAADKPGQVLFAFPESNVDAHRPGPGRTLRHWVDIYLYGVYVLRMKAEIRGKVLGRVKRITGQVAGIQRMIEEDRYCVDILNQISAVRSALDALGVELLTNHLETCVVGKPDGNAHPKAKPMKPEALLAEVQHVLSRFLR
jgi:CsoR family transcriptional regulator, copper-sensing transcriptional repressor